MIETMTVRRYHSLSASDKAAWDARLRKQWRVEPADTAEFYHDGDRITGVLVYRRDENGRLYVDDSGYNVVRELLGVASE